MRHRLRAVSLRQDDVPLPVAAAAARAPPTAAVRHREALPGGARRPAPPLTSPFSEIALCVSSLLSRFLLWILRRLFLAPIGRHICFPTARYSN